MNLFNKLRSLTHISILNKLGLGSEVTDKKILVLGLAKSGTSILMYRIANGLKERREFFEPRSNEGANDLIFHQERTALKGNVITKLVFQPMRKNQLDKIIPLYDKVIWIHRDPRDRLLSAFFYKWFKGHKPDPLKYERALALTQQKEKAPAAVPFHQMMGIPFSKKFITNYYQNTTELLQRFKGQIFEIYYESFIDGDIQDLEHYLGFRIDQKAEVKNSVKRVARSRKHGNWRKWYTPEDVTFYQPILNPFLADFGYDVTDWSLEEVDCLPSDIGSEYMIRMFNGG